MSGDLVRLEVPDLLHFLHMGRRTGVLLMERPGEHASLYFRDGGPIYANSSREGLRLSDILERQGKLKAADVQRIVASHRATGYRIGQILVTEKLLTEEELISYLKIQTSEVVFDTFRWRGGTFSFYDEVGPPGDAVVLDIDLQNLIMEGVRRIDEDGRLGRVFPNLRWQAAAVSNPERVKQSVTLTPQEWRVYFLVDGRRNLSEICQIAGEPDERATLEVLRRLVEANLVSIAPPRPGTPEEKAGSMDAAPDGARGAEIGLEPEDAKPKPEKKGPRSAVKVEFAAAHPVPRPDDDRSKIVDPEAVDYQSPTSPASMPRLILVRDAEEVSFPLTRDSYAVGRHANNDIVVENERVSAFHARIDRVPEGYVLVDLRSTNGTFLNSGRVTIGVLRSGDEIRLGPARLRFELDWTAGPTTSRRAKSGGSAGATPRRAAPGRKDG